MAGFSVAKIKDTVDGIFPLKTFCLSLALLLLLLIGTTGIYQLFIAEPVGPVAPTGKTIAILEMPRHIEDQPIQTIVEEPQAPVSTESPSKPAGDETLEPPSPEDAHHSTIEDIPQTTEIVIEDSIAGLSETTPLGPLPIIRESDGLRSFEAYKAPFKLKPDSKSVISLVMVDYGLSDRLAKNAVESLPAATTFVASPYSDNLQAKISGARSKGMEVWMGIPMQGTRNSTIINMGPHALLSGLNTKENIMRLNTHLGRATGYAGIAFDVHPTFSQGSPELQAIINALSTRGLGVAQMEQEDTLIDMAAAHINAPYVNGDIWIDEILTKDAIATALAQAEKISLSGGHAVAVFHPSLLVNTVIAEWKKSLPETHIQLAPLTYTTNISRTSPHKEAEPAREAKEKAETAHHGSH